MRLQHRRTRPPGQQVELQYRQTVLNVLQEVATQLEARQKLAEARMQQERAVAANREAVKTAFENHHVGTAAYFLQVQQQLFSAETNLRKSN